MTKSERAKELGGFVINGRMFFFHRISSFTKLGNGKFEAVRNGTTYRIEGGKKAGGSRTDWFIDADGWSKSINCTSLIDALNVINGM